MKNKPLLKAIIIILLAFAAGTVIYMLFSPQPSPPPNSASQSATTMPGTKKGQGYGQGFGQVVKQLNFSDEQTEAFGTLESQYRTSINRLIAQMDSLDRAILTELTQTEPNATLLAQWALASGKSQQTLKQKTIEHFLALREICTPDQLQQYKVIFHQINQFRQGQGQGQGQGRQQGRGLRRRWGQSN